MPKTERSRNSNINITERYKKLKIPEIVQYVCLGHG